MGLDARRARAGPAIEVAERGAGQPAAQGGAEAAAAELCDEAGHDGPGVAARHERALRALDRLRALRRELSDPRGLRGDHEHVVHHAEVDVLRLALAG